MIGPCADEGQITRGQSRKDITKVHGLAARAQISSVRGIEKN